MQRQSMAWLAAWLAVCAILLAASALLLSACAAPATSDTWRNPPRNGVGIPVDPVYGTPAPGSPPIY
jgi:hypothetical protein